MRNDNFVLKGITLLAALVLLQFTGCGREMNGEPAAQAASPAPEWKVIGPGGGGGVFLPTISPFDPDFVFTHCDMTAAYVSYDGGVNWRTINLWNVPEDFEFDPNNAGTVYTAVRGFSYSEDRGSGLSILYRSEDRGEHWHAVYPDVSKAKYLDELQSVNLKPSEVVEGAFDGTIQKVTVDPADSRTIYLGLAPLVSYMAGPGQPVSQPAMLVRSTDYGATWKLLAELPGRSVLGIFPGSQDGRPGEINVITERASVRIDAASGELKELPKPAERITYAEAGTGKNGTKIYVITPMRNAGGKISGGVFRSDDWSATWTQVNAGLLLNIPEGETPMIPSLGVCRTNPDVVYLSSRNGRSVSHDNRDIWIYGIFKTENGGAEWKPVLLSNSFGYLGNNYTGSWMDVIYDPGWGGNPIDLGVAPGNADICIATDAGRAYRTLDGGKTWKQIYSQEQPDGTVATGGLNVTTCYGVHFDPFDKNHFFISYTDIGLFQTRNGGKSWSSSITGIPERWINTCYWVAFDPQVKDRLWSVWANAHDLPRDKMFGNTGTFERFQGGVALSEDGGLSWRACTNGIPENTVGTNVLVDPESPRDSRTLYVTAFGQGVFKSSDGGASWKEANRGLGDNRCAWQIRRNKDGKLYLLLSRGRKDRGQVTVAGELYTSADQAASWQPVALPEGENAPHDLQIDPADTRRMYLSCWSVAKDDRDVSGGLYRTEDGGKSWKLVFDKVRRINSAALDPVNPNTIYLNTFQNSAWRSDDRGDSWRRLEGYRFKWGQRAIPDVNNPGMLFLTTYGGSVYYGPAEGVPGAFEDIDNLPRQWW